MRAEECRIVGDTEQLKAFARAVSRQALVIVDEAYLEFADHFTQRTPADMVRGGENGFACGYCGLPKHPLLSPVLLLG
jgi:hypothetical protein